MTLSFWQKLLSKTFLFLKGTIQRQTIGARGILIDDNKVLLIRHSYLPHWQFPGGGVDVGETFENTMRREVLEETGYLVNGAVELYGVFHNIEATNRDHLAIYIARDFEIAHQFKPSREIVDMQWFDINELPNNIATSAKRRIDEIFNGVAKDLKW